MYLETSDRRSLFHDRVRRRIASSPRPRPARTPPPAFLFLPIHLSNSPGAKHCPHPSENRRADEASSSENCRMAFHCSSEELQRRVIAAKRGGRRRWVVYRGRPDPLSTTKIESFLTAIPARLFEHPASREPCPNKYLVRPLPFSMPQRSHIRTTS